MGGPFYVCPVTEIVMSHLVVLICYLGTLLYLERAVGLIWAVLFTVVVGLLWVQVMKASLPA